MGTKARSREGQEQGAGKEDVLEGGKNRKGRGGNSLLSSKEKYTGSNQKGRVEKDTPTDT